MANIPALILTLLSISSYLNAQIIEPTVRDKARPYFGYNTFNEVYAGIQLGGASATKPTIELGYQFALQQQGYYTFGLVNLPNPFRTNNASGIRLRVGMRLSQDEQVRAQNCVYLEYQNLQSNQWIEDPGKASGSHNSAYSEFTESYDKLGFKFSHISPTARLGSNLSISFLYSVGIYYVRTHRIYTIQGTYSNKTPSNEESDSIGPGAQFNIGLRFWTN